MASTTIPAVTLEHTRSTQLSMLSIYTQELAGLAVSGVEALLRLLEALIAPLSFHYKYEFWSSDPSIDGRVHCLKLSGLFLM